MINTGKNSALSASALGTPFQPLPSPCLFPNQRLEAAPGWLRSGIGYSFLAQDLSSAFRTMEGACSILLSPGALASTQAATAIRVNELSGDALRSLWASNQRILLARGRAPVAG